MRSLKTKRKLTLQTIKYRHVFAVLCFAVAILSDLSVLVSFNYLCFSRLLRCHWGNRFTDWYMGVTNEGFWPVAVHNETYQSANPYICHGMYVIMKLREHNTKLYYPNNYLRYVFTSFEAGSSEILCCGHNTIPLAYKGCISRVMNKSNGMSRYKEWWFNSSWGLGRRGFRRKWN